MIDLIRLRKYIDDESRFPLFYRLNQRNKSGQHVIEIWTRGDDATEYILSIAVNRIAVKYMIDRGEDMKLYRWLATQIVGKLCNKMEDIDDH